MSDPQDIAQSLDEDELPADIAPDKFIDPDDWDAGAGADEDDDEDGLSDEDDIAQERESALNAEDAAMHVERGIAASDDD